MQIFEEIRYQKISKKLSVFNETSQTIAVMKQNNYLCITVNIDGYILIRKEVIMKLMDYVNSIPFEGLPFLCVNGYEFHWNGNFWEEEMQ